MKNIQELQNANKRKNRFSIQEAKDSKRFAKVYAGLQNHEVFMWIYIHRIKRQRNCSISGEINLLLVRTVKQAKIRKNQGKIHLYPLKTAYF